MQIEWTLNRLESGSVSATDLKREFSENFEGVTDSSYSHLIQSLSYTTLIENQGLTRLSVWGLTEMGQFFLDKLREKHAKA